MVLTLTFGYKVLTNRFFHTPNLSLRSHTFNEILEIALGPDSSCYEHLAKTFI